jgi:hypothetical protein
MNRIIFNNYLFTLCDYTHMRYNHILYLLSSMAEDKTSLFYFFILERRPAISFLPPFGGSSLSLTEWGRKSQLYKPLPSLTCYYVIKNITLAFFPLFCYYFTCTTPLRSCIYASHKCKPESYAFRCLPFLYGRKSKSRFSVK